MIVCSCAVISDHDIEAALLDVLSDLDAPIPTPGLVYRQLGRRMVCGGCAPVAVEIIYEKMDDLEQRGLVCPYRCANVRSRLAPLRRRELQAGPSKEAE